MDIKDEQWEVIKPLIVEPPKRPDGKGRPRLRRDAEEIGTKNTFSASGKRHPVDSPYRGTVAPTSRGAVPFFPDLSA